MLRGMSRLGLRRAGDRLVMLEATIRMTPAGSTGACGIVSVSITEDSFEHGDIRCPKASHMRMILNLICEDHNGGQRGRQLLCNGGPAEPTTTLVTWESACALRTIRRRGVASARLFHRGRRRDGYCARRRLPRHPSVTTDHASDRVATLGRPVLQHLGRHRASPLHLTPSASARSDTRLPDRARSAEVPPGSSNPCHRCLCGNQGPPENTKDSRWLGYMGRIQTEHGPPGTPNPARPSNRAGITPGSRSCVHAMVDHLTGERTLV